MKEQDSDQEIQGLRIDKSRFEKILEILPDFLYIVDLDYKITYINRVEQCETRDSLIGQPIFTQAATPEEAKQLKRLLDHIQQTKEPAHFQASQTFAEETRHFYSSITPRISEEGKLMEFIFLTRDITSVVETQSSLASSEANFNSLFHNSTFAFIEISAPLVKNILEELRTVDPKQVDQYLQDNIRLTAKALGSAGIIRANQRFFELFEIDNKEQLIEMLFTYNYLPVAQAPVNAFFKALLAGQKTLETRFPLHFWVKPQKTIVASINLEQVLETERVLIGYLDITPLEKVQSQLQLNHQRLRTVMETAPIGMMEVHMGPLMQFFDSVVNVLVFCVAQSF
ncbi:MAG: PAS domain-containing protein, partial [Bacteroidota bacterium]